jgi:hypothetical protein
MKRNYKLLLSFLLVTVSILAQTPEKMSYQVVLRDASNTLLTNQQVGIQISILQTTITGSAVYTETQTATTNINGLVSIEIGTGTSSDDFSTIDWGAGSYFIKTATDASGGSNYTITGTSQLMSVPYALYAKTSGSSTPGPQGAPGTNETHTGDVTGATVLTITNDAVTTAKILDANVTDAKIAAVSASKLTGVVGIAKGGTNIATYTQGDILYATSATELTKLPAGTAGQVLTMNTGATAPEWVAATTATHAIGDTHQGGIIFYLDASGKHGLISAPTDQSTSAAWWNGSYIDTRAYGSGLFEGKYNTKIINWGQGGTTSAAAICANYGDGRWYLPSIEELNLMFKNIGQGNALGLGNIGHFLGYYWSSTEDGNNYAWRQYFDFGGQTTSYKDNTYYVRAVRAF